MVKIMENPIKIDDLEFGGTIIFGNIHICFDSALSVWPLRQVTDDEGAQHKAFNYAWERMRLRGFSESETSHPAWNSFKKAVAHSSLTVGMMKLALCCSTPEFSLTTCLLFFGPGGY